MASLMERGNVETTVDGEGGKEMTTPWFHDEGFQVRTVVHTETPVYRFVTECLSFEEDADERREVVEGKGSEGRNSIVVDSDGLYGAAKAVEGFQLREYRIDSSLIVAVVTPLPFKHNATIAIIQTALSVPLSTTPLTFVLHLLSITVVRRPKTLVQPIHTNTFKSYVIV